MLPRNRRPRPGGPPGRARACPWFGQGTPASARRGSGRVPRASLGLRARRGARDLPRRPGTSPAVRETASDECTWRGRVLGMSKHLSTPRKKSETPGEGGCGEAAAPREVADIKPVVETPGERDGQGEGDRAVPLATKATRALPVPPKRARVRAAAPGDEEEAGAGRREGRLRAEPTKRQLPDRGAARPRSRGTPKLAGADRDARVPTPVGRPRAMPEIRLRKRAGRASVYYIHHGRHQESTGTSDPKQAQIRLAVYLAKDDDAVQRRLPALMTIGSMIDERRTRENDAPGSMRAKDLASLDERLRGFWGDKHLGDVTSDACDRYRASRVRVRKPFGPVASGTVRSELKRLRTIINDHCDRNGIVVRPFVALPSASTPRSRWLWRHEVARLLVAARGRTWDELRGDWKRHPDGKLVLVDPEKRALARPLLRLILVGAFTGTREGDLIRAGWRRSPSGGYFDLSTGNLHRRGSGRAVTNKRTPVVRLCPELFRLVARWAASDAARGFDRLIHDDDGGAIGTSTLLGRFARVRKRSGLGGRVNVHALRHTCATWLLLGGASLENAAQYLGLTVAELEKTYAQVDVAFTAAAADALDDWGRSKGAGRSVSRGAQPPVRSVVNVRPAAER